MWKKKPIKKRNCFSYIHVLVYNRDLCIEAKDTTH